MRWPQGLLKRIREFSRAHKVAAVAIATGGVAVAGTVTYVSVEQTSTVAFCTSCHEMQPAYDSYIESSHYRVEDASERASCRDCHVPPWSRPVSLLWTKASHGAKDVYAHFVHSDKLDTPGFHERMLATAAHGVPDSACLTCHGDVYEEEYPGRRNIHAVLNGNRRARCAECHRGLVHHPYPLR